MTLINETAATGSKRFARLTAAAAMLAVVLAFGSGPGSVRAIGAPLTFTVVQSPAGPASVLPADAVTYTVNFTSNAAVSFLYIEGNLGPALSVASFSGGSGCSGIGTSSFSCGPVSLGATSSIAPFTVNAAVRNVADGTVIDLAPSAFVAKDGSGDASGASPSTDPAALTIENESIAITNTPSLAAVFEAGLVSFTANLVNNGSGGSGVYNSLMTLAGGAVENVVCPGGAPGSGTGTTVATCSNNAALAAAGSTTMVVTAKASDAGPGTLSATVALAPGAGNVTGSPAGIQYVPPAAANVGVSELALVGGGTFLTGSLVAVCTTNNPANPALTAGLMSGANPFATADYQLLASGGAVPSPVAVAVCPAGQQGVAFTSASAGTVSVTARTNAPGSGTAVTGNSNTVVVTFTAAPVPNPVPVLSSIAPTSAGAGSPALPLVVTGSNFVAGSIVRWNGTDLVTTFGSPAALSAMVPAANILMAGSAVVTVFSPTPGGGTSAGQAFTVNAAPAITSLTPSSTPSGGAAFQLVIAGSNFVPGSIVRWNGADLTTTYSTGVAISAQVPASNIATANLASVTVFNPGSGGGLSNSLTFTTTSSPAKLGFTTQPSNGVVSVALPTQPVVAVQDAGGVTVTTDNSTVVTLALTGPGTLTCTGGLSKTAAAGVATFAGCAVSAAGTGDKLTATSAPVLTSAQSALFNVTAQAPTSSAQLVVAAPAAGVNVARSRLTFSATTGSLSSPTSVTFIIKRKSDNKYWNDGTGAWEAFAVENAATSAASIWTFAITGEDRRAFAGTTVIVEARAVSGSATYVSAVLPEIAIR